MFMGWSLETSAGRNVVPSLPERDVVGTIRVVPRDEQFGVVRSLPATKDQSFLGILRVPAIPHMLVQELLVLWVVPVHIDDGELCGDAELFVQDLARIHHERDPEVSVSSSRSDPDPLTLAPAEESDAESLAIAAVTESAILLAHDVFAGFAMAMSSVSVVSNSLRIKAKKL
jgi:hypothetical protein